MYRIKALFTNRWFYIILGLLALAAIIWFVGPMISIGESTPLESVLSRIIAMLVIVLIFIISILWKMIAAKRKDKQLVDGMAEVEEQRGPSEGEERARQSAEEVNALKARFEDAVTVLKKGKGEKRAHSLYELPWYIIIGPPGCGKTTALVNSGLEFPLGDQFGREAVRGVGGTRNCDWWISNEAVLLDTAGRYTTQDSDATVDSAAWDGFLGLLKKYRKRRPINGAIVSFSLPDLMAMDANARSEHARTIRRRIQELNEKLGLTIPVYMMFTKCDLVAGFMDYYDDLRREEREQVWGVTFPLPGEDPDVQKQFAEEFDLLQKRLDDRLAWRLINERDLRRRSAIFSFPQQMAALKKAMDTFTHEIFTTSRFEKPTFLRGIYFSSGTQEGMPIDRLMGSLAATFNLDRQKVAPFTGPGKSYFITDLLKRVIFAEQRLAGADRRSERIRAWVQRGAYAAAFLLTVGGAFAWTTSFTTNKGFVTEVDLRVANFNELTSNELTADSDFEDVLALLNSLRDTLDFVRENTNDPPWHMRFGLYQGEGLGDAVHDAYLRELNALLVPSIASSIEEQLATGPEQADYKYEALKAYLMLADHSHLDKEFIKLWMGLMWQQSYGGQPRVQDRLHAHLDYLFEHGPSPIKTDRDLVAQTRGIIQQTPLAELVYGNLKRQPKVAEAEPFVLADQIGRDGFTVFDLLGAPDEVLEIPALFTYSGFYQLFQLQSTSLVNQMRGESWVLGPAKGSLSERELKELETDVLDLYQDEYIRRWDRMLAEIDVVPFQDMPHAIEITNILSATKSPMLALLKAVERNTKLMRLPEGVGTVADIAKEEIFRRNYYLSRLIKIGEDTGAGDRVNAPGERVERHYERLHKIMDKGRSSRAPVDRTMTLLEQLYDYMSALSVSGSERDYAIPFGGTDRKKDIFQLIQTQSARQPEPLRKWMRQVAANAQSLTLGDARSKLSKLWKAEVVPACNRLLTDRYPMSKTASKQVHLTDFSKLFAKDGLIDQFFSTHLAPFVDMSSDPWQWRPQHKKSLGMSDSTLRQFQYAHTITEAFFSDGGKQPSVRFTLKPISLDDRIKTLSIEFGNQRLSFDGANPLPSEGEWPGPGRANLVKLTVVDQQDEEHTIVREGPWAWFKLLESGGLRLRKGERYSAHFSIKGYRASFYIRATSALSPFKLKELQLFKCPASL